MAFDQKLVSNSDFTKNGKPSLAACRDWGVGHRQNNGAEPPSHFHQDAFIKCLSARRPTTHGQSHREVAARRA
eukprot:scaffold8546_cov73-Cylindrotheca_fusiformis.AAC.6